MSEENVQKQTNDPLNEEILEQQPAGQSEATEQDNTAETESADNAEEKTADALEEAQAHEKELEERLMRMQADFDNFKKRTAKEKQDIAQYTLEDFLKKLLPVLDNLERAEKGAETDNIESYKQGVDMVFKQLQDVLNAEGLAEIETKDAQFDPNYHHGVAVEDNPDYDDQCITDVFQKGYQFKDKVIRPAMVKVCQK